MSIDVAVVPVAGRGTRLLPLTKSQPKEMLPVGQKPVVQYVAEELLLSGVDRLSGAAVPGPARRRRREVPEIPKRAVAPGRARRGR